MREGDIILVSSICILDIEVRTPREERRDPRPRIDSSGLLVHRYLCCLGDGSLMLDRVL